MRFPTSAVSSSAGTGVLVFFCDDDDDLEGILLPLTVQDFPLDVVDSGAGDWSPVSSGSSWVSCSISCSEPEESVGSDVSRRGFNCKDKKVKHAVSIW